MADKTLAKMSATDLVIDFHNAVSDAVAARHPNPDIA